MSTQVTNQNSINQNKFNVIVEWDSLVDVNWSMVRVVTYQPNYQIATFCLMDIVTKKIIAVGPEKTCQDFLDIRIDALAKIEIHLKKAKNAGSINKALIYIGYAKSVASRIQLDIEARADAIRRIYLKGGLENSGSSQNHGLKIAC